MDKEDSNNSIWKQIKSMWNSLPEILKLLGTILSIAIALKALFPAAAVGISNLMQARKLSNLEDLLF